MHTFASDRICQPLDREGFGLRTVSQIATAAVQRQTWYIVNKGKSLWVDWMSKKYIKDKPFKNPNHSMIMPKLGA